MKPISILLNEALQETNLQTALIVPKGEFPHAVGKQIVDDAALERILAAIIANVVDIEVDYNHAAIKGITSPEQGKAAGWIKPASMKITADGITGDIAWNELAAKMIRAKEYRYLSPVFAGTQMPSGDWRVDRLINVALCNVPNIPQEPLINESQILKEKPKMELKKLAQALGLPESATEADVLAAITANKEAAVAANSVYSKLAVNDATGAMTKIIELQKPPAHSPQEINGLQARVAALESEKGETVIANAITEGKITPAQKDWAKDYYTQNPQGFLTYLANAVPVVPLASAATGAASVAANSAVMTDTDRKICAALGVSEDLYKKTNGLN